MSDQSEQLKGCLFGSFIGDAISLGVHWIYDADKIQKLHGRIADYVDPSDNRYHAKRKRGDLSHYGDQALALMRSLEGGAGFSLPAFAERWQAMWPHYSGYVDGATKDTLNNLESGQPLDSVGSKSNDLAGAGRIAPLLVALSESSEDDLAAAARAQTAFTHNDPGVVEAAEFFARLTRRVLEGDAVEEIIEKLAATGDFPNLGLEDALDAVRKGLFFPASEALPAFGLTCHLPDALPATIFLLIKHGDDLETALIENAMAGGDSAARGLLLGLVLGAAHGFSAIPARWVTGLNAGAELVAWMASQDCGCGIDAVPDPGTNKVEFTNREGHTLSAKLDWPPNGAKPTAVAIFAHCFTCTKDLPAIARISRALGEEGVAVLRFDFTGLGGSAGEFSDTNFSSNVEDLVAAAEYLEKRVGAPDLLIGHSLGGAAAIAAARRIRSVRGIATIGTPSEPAHLGEVLSETRTKALADGQSDVEIGGLGYTLKRQFFEDIQSQNVLGSLKEFDGSLLVLHSPLDRTVDVDHAAKLFMAARHPKSFVSLDEADHLLTRPADSRFAAKVIAAWAHHLFE